MPSTFTCHYSVTFHPGFIFFKPQTWVTQRADAEKRFPSQVSIFLTTQSLLNWPITPLMAVQSVKVRHFQRVDGSLAPFPMGC